MNFVFLSFIFFRNKFSSELNFLYFALLGILQKRLSMVIPEAFTYNKTD